MRISLIRCSSEMDGLPEGAVTGRVDGMASERERAWPFPLIKSKSRSGLCAKERSFGGERSE